MAAVAPQGAQVFLEQVPDYEPGDVRAAVFRLLERTAPPVRRGDRVLIKPNFLAPAPPARAITTHPLVVRAAAEWALGRGGRVLVADSPGMGSFERLLREGGYAAALAGLPLEIRAFRETAWVDIGPPFGSIPLARDALAADVVLNLPKLKSHCMMLLTLGVKNLFGCVVGLAKPEWHLRCGVDRASFARLLVGICAAVRPAVTLLDGILALEGDGPGKGGIPRPVGVLLASPAAPALDAAVCRMLGIRPEELPTHRAALECGALPPALAVEGDLPRVAGFRLPVLAPLTFGPRRLEHLMRMHLVQRPVLRPKAACRGCGECVRACPVKAVAPCRDGVAFDYRRCIRCYCCVEMCPHGLLRTAETAPGRLLRHLAALRGRLARRPHRPEKAERERSPCT